jgi:hypothetical protein
MSEGIIQWILGSWNIEISQEINKKRIKTLASTLRLFVNTIKTKSGRVLPEYKTQCSEMANWLEGVATKNKYEEAAVAISAVTYARKYLGNSVVQASAVKSKLKPEDRKRIRQLSRRAAKRLTRSPEPEHVADNLNGYDLQSGDMGDDPS